MKKLLTILFLFCSYLSFGQFNPTFGSGSASTLNYQRGATGADIGIVWKSSFGDTTAANVNAYVKGVPGAVIRTVNTLWMRNSTATAWIQYTGNGGGSLDTLYWRNYGNSFDAAVRDPTIGTTSSHPFKIITNNVLRATIPVSGINLNTASNLRVLTIDPVTREVYYGSINGGATSGYTFENGLTESPAGTVKLGGVLTGQTIIEGGTNNFFMYDLGPTTIQNTSTTATHISTTNGTDSSYVDIRTGGPLSQKKAVMGSRNISAGTTYLTEVSAGLAGLIDIRTSNVNYTGFISMQDDIILSQTLATGENSRIGMISDSVWLNPWLGQFNIDTLRPATGENTLMAWRQGTDQGRVGYVTLGSGLSLSSGVLNTSGTVATPISSLTAATGTNDINNGAFSQTWRWPTMTAGDGGLLITSNSITSGQLLNLSTIGTASATGQKLLGVVLSGTNATSSVTTYGIHSQNGHAGTTSTNVAGYFESINGTNNYAIIVPSSGGNVGIGTSTPVASSLLEMVSTTRGFLAPRMTEAQRDLIGTPATGLLIYQTNGTAGFYYYSGAAWTVIGGGGSGITVGTTTITSGTDTRIAFNNAGVYGEDADLQWYTPDNAFSVGASTGDGSIRSYQTAGFYVGMETIGAKSGIRRSNTDFLLYYNTSTGRTHIDATYSGNPDLYFDIQGTTKMNMNGSGRLFIGGTTSATALLHTAAGTASANTAPIKFTSGTNLTTPEAGAIEYDATEIYGTNSTAVRGTVLVIRSNVTAADPVTLATTYTHYVGTGTTSTWTLPAVSGTANHVFLIKNRGSGTITLNAAAAANEIYTTSAVNTLAITAGSAVMLVSDGSFWNLE